MTATGASNATAKDKGTTVGPGDGSGGSRGAGGGSSDSEEEDKEVGEEREHGGRKKVEGKESENVDMVKKILPIS